MRGPRRLTSLISRGAARPLEHALDHRHWRGGINVLLCFLSYPASVSFVPSVMPFFRSFAFTSLLLCASVASPALRAAEMPVLVDQSHSRILMQVKTDFSGFTAELTDYHIDVLADAESGQIVSAQVNFPFSALKTGDAHRDRDMLAWENNDQFPQVVCTLTRLDPHGEAKFTAQGEVLFHGVKKAISFPATVIINPNQSYVVDGEIEIDTRDFNLPKVRKYLIVTVNPVVHVVFHLQAALMKR